ncbi:MAG: hypothetical protein OXB94_11985 [Nitrospira sp.]|nr:hypothetical protein [Nitrospira sp.]
MINQLDKSRYAGIFSVAPDRKVNGNLSLDGRNTSLYVWDENFFYPVEGKTITGILDNRMKVSLIDCLISGPGSYGRQGDTSNFCTIFPHYVVFGDQHISYTDKEISKVSFLLDDATTLFHDYNAFGFASDARSIVKQIVESGNMDCEIGIGNRPLVAYYTGKQEIFSSNTVHGTISASHAPGYTMGSSRGVKIDNTIYIHIKFDEAITFMDVVDRLWKAKRFFELIVGRAQNLVECIIDTGTDEKPQPLDVYSSMTPKYQRPEKDFEIIWQDVLIDAVRNPNRFSDVLAAWLERENIWRDARERFFQSFEKQKNYHINRLISAANMFDIMPEAAFPEPEKLPSDLNDAKEKAKKIFKELPQTAERDSVLSELGRVGSLRLKRKIASRCSCLLSRIGERLPELSLVTDEAVNCRNHYVHGSESRIDYNKEPNIQFFLTDTLEFVFAASDLIDAGWDIVAWCETGYHVHHPLGAYMERYSSELEKLKSLLPT